MTVPRWTDAPGQPVAAVDAHAVRSLARTATTVDGVAPLAEQTLLSLGSGAHLLLDGPSGLLAFATAGDGTGELVVHPDARRRGIGRLMLTALLERAGQIWAHGDLPAARATAAAAGLRPLRTLHQLRRDSAVPVPEAAWPAGVTLRSFRPGADEPSWLAVNAAAFARHPEQGRWGPADLAAREAEPWFDPAGFFLAERGGELVGFHWTKIADGLGEVYVVGVSPREAGAGLGKALTVVGLAYLRSLVPTVLLYVDDDNPRALAMYEHLGFTRFRADVAYGR